MKQSTVEWLVNKLNLFNITKEEHYEILCQIELEAKEMEKQQIIDACYFGSQNLPYEIKDKSEQYYNETFKNK